MRPEAKGKAQVKPVGTQPGAWLRLLIQSPGGGAGRGRCTHACSEKGASSPCRCSRPIPARSSETTWSMLGWRRGDPAPPSHCSRRQSSWSWQLPGPWPQALRGEWAQVDSKLQIGLPSSGGTLKSKYLTQGQPCGTTPPLAAPFERDSSTGTHQGHMQLVPTTHLLCRAQSPTGSPTQTQNGHVPLKTTP